MFADEKNRLEKLLADNKLNSEQEKNRIEKQHEDAISKVKLEENKSAKVLKDLIAEKEQNIAEKSNLIDRLKEQNLQVSEDLAKYSEEIKIQIKSLQNEKENCEARSKKSEEEYTIQLEQQKDHIKRILQEGKTTE